MFYLFSIQVMEKLNFRGFGNLNIFIIGYFGVVFNLVSQTFTARMSFQRCRDFDATVLSKYVFRICTNTSGSLYYIKI